MKENEIKAVDLVRRNRDEMADEWADKTPEEVIAFFNKARDEALEKMRRKVASSAPERKAG